MNSCELKICIVGLGYIGLPTASVLAAKGIKVLGCDINRDIVNTINEGKIHIIEPELETIVRSVVASGCLKAACSPQLADVFIITVPTPINETDHSPDISFVEAATQSIAEYLQPENLLILESTSPVGTTEKMCQWISQYRPDLFENSKPKFHVAYCPERVLPGYIIKEIVENDRIVGGIDVTSAQRARDFYKLFVKGNIFITNARTAEMSKLVENSFRDVNIAFANELSLICEDLNINVWELIELANRHPRVNILKPGPGVGGHCIAVDPWFIVSAAPEKAKLIKCARQVNNNKPHHVIAKIETLARKFIKPKIGCLGLAFKPNIDDLRESPSLFIVEQLIEKNLGELYVVEPHIDKLPAHLSSEKAKLVSLSHCINEADILVLLVDHNDFYQIKSDQLSKKPFVDTRGLWHETSIN
jgi:UDP-N-acetyl-D-mannosaminuronic acid dehydrogenase